MKATQLYLLFMKIWVKFSKIRVFFVFCRCLITNGWTRIYARVFVKFMSPKVQACAYSNCFVCFFCLNFIPDQWMTLAWLCLWPNPCHFQAFLRSTPDTHWEKRKYLGSSTILLIADAFPTLACVTFQLPTNQSFRLILLPLPPHLTLLNIILWI